MLTQKKGFNEATAISPPKFHLTENDEVTIILWVIMTFRKIAQKLTLPKYKPFFHKEKNPNWNGAAVVDVNCINWQIQMPYVLTSSNDLIPQNKTAQTTDFQAMISHAVLFSRVFTCTRKNPFAITSRHSELFILTLQHLYAIIGRKEGI